MEFDKRERIEWLNYWIEDANVYKKRIILIGDSVTRDLRKKMSFYLNKNFAVDLLAMSYSILDDMVMAEIKHYFQSSVYRYEYIIYNMGAHHGYHIKCLEENQGSKEFENRTIEILSFLKKYCHSIIAVSSTLENFIDSSDMNLFHYNDEIKERNHLLKLAAEKLHITFFNLDEKIDYRTLKYSDRCHFSDKTYENIAKTIIVQLFPEISCASANQIETLQELKEKIEQYQQKKIYVYGNGIKGNFVKMYLEKYRFDGFIVSNEYYEISDEVFMISQIERNNALIIVTLLDANVWERLALGKYDYITLNADIYIFLRMYTEHLFMIEGV